MLLYIKKENPEIFELTYSSKRGKKYYQLFFSKGDFSIQ